MGSRGFDHPAHDPRVLANLPAAGETVLLEEFDRLSEQEATRGVPAGRHLGDGLDETTSRPRDLIESALKCRPRNALTAVFRVDVEAGDPPVGQRRCVLVVLTPMSDAGEFLGASVLAPPLRGAAIVEDERSVGAAGPDAVLLRLTVRKASLGRFRVVPDAPAPA